MMHKIQIPKPKRVGNYAYGNELKKLKISDKIDTHMSYIFFYVLYDKFDFKQKKLCNFCDRVITLKNRWHDDSDPEITSESLYDYCLSKGINVTGWINSIPISQKLYIADIKGSCPIGANYNIDYSILAIIILAIPVLKENYRMSNKDINKFLDHIKYFIDSYWRKQPGCKEHYLCDDDIWRLFIDEVHWDIKKGEKVAL